MTARWVSGPELWADAKRVCTVSAGEIRRLDGPLVFRVWPPRSQTALNAVHNTELYANHPYFKAKRDKESTARLSAIESVLHTACAGLQELRDLRLLDVGCDTGTLMEVAHSRFGMRVEGLDVSRHAIEQVRRKGMVGHCADIHAFQADGKYDLVILNDVVEHVSAPQLLLAAAANLLRPGGRLYIATPNAEALLYTMAAPIAEMAHVRFLTEKLFPPFHEWCFSPLALRELVSTLGLRVVHHDTMEFPLTEFGHGHILKAGFAVFACVQKLLGKKSLQVLVAERPSEKRQ